MSALVARAVALVPRAALVLPPRARLAALAAAVAAAVLALAWFGWFRDSGLVAVEDVRVTGLSAPDADRIESALVAVGREMTTLHVSVDELERAVAGFPVVRSIAVSTDFPHGLRIRVVERRPVALLATGGRRVPLAGDGTLLADARARGGLPEIRARASTAGARLSDPTALALAAAAAAAPAPLRARLDRIELTRDRGLVAFVAGGPVLVLGDTRRLRAKWTAAARVLADPSSAGASYVDVRLPERPAAGGLAVEPPPQAPPPAGQPAPGPTPQPTPGATPAPQTGGAHGAPPG